jgi:hypothetical protein
VKGRDQDIWIAKNVTAGTLKTQAKRDARTSTAAR